MITEFFISLFFGIVNGLVNFLPTFDISSIGGFTAIITSLVACSAFMPLSAFTVCMGIWLGFQALKLASSLLNWTLRKILLG